MQEIQQRNPRWRKLFKLYILDLMWLEFHINILHNQEYYLLIILNVIFLDNWKGSSFVNIYILAPSRWHNPQLT
jgi:hypothetical protein